MPTERSGPVDVLVIGGGPAGATLSILLARLGHSVVLLERSRYDRARAGETFGGELMPVLQAAGLLDDLQAVPMTPFRGVRASWGSAEQAERSSVFNPFGEGWHVERVAFDAALAAIATRAGVDLRTGASASAVERVGAAWSASLASGETLAARFLVDASGRGARTAVTLGLARWIQMDRLVAIIGHVIPPAGSVDPVLELEAVESGWWYSAPQSDGKMLVAQMTDADLIDAGSRAGLAARFNAALDRTTHTARRCGGARVEAAPWVARADSGFLHPDRGDAWCAIGDAAMGGDPLAGDGVVRGIRSAMDAASRIAQAPGAGGPGKPGGPTRDHADALRDRFMSYLDLRESYYRRERRYGTETFWARRHPVDWRAAPLFLDPLQPLRWDGVVPARDLVAPVEALIPAPAVRTLLQHLRPSLPAHQALALLRAEAPLQDRRLLVAVQDLVARGVVGGGM
jgi:flavin-dependent dehydrogenase